MSKNSEIIEKKKKANREEDLEQIQTLVSQNLPHLTSAALAAALGGTVVLKMIMNDQGKIKYVPCSTAEEVAQGLEWIAQYGNHLDAEEGFYIVQQRPPDPKFWEALTHRHLGKIPDSEKESKSARLDLAEIGRKAIENSQNNPDNLPSTHSGSTNPTKNAHSIKHLPSSWQ